MPFSSLVLNTLFSWSAPPGEVRRCQQRRLALYAVVILFRTLVLFIFLNRVQDLFQGEEGVLTSPTDI